LLHRYVGFLPLLARAAVVTLEVSILGMVVAIIVGLGLAIARRYGKRLVATVAAGYIETIRGTPLLIQILFVFYGLPNIGIKLDPFIAGVLALGLNYAAYEAENYRAGLEAIPRGQMEAAVALDLTQGQALRLVIVPQAFRIVIPVMTNDFISLLKDSSLVSVITMAELTRTYEQLSTTYYDYFGTGLLVGAVYLLIGLPFVRLARWTERRLNVDARVRRPVSSAFAAR
jgi:polar amino acid transport system substrate-binding protein